MISISPHPEFAFGIPSGPDYLVLVALTLVCLLVTGLVLWLARR